MRKRQKKERNEETEIDFDYLLVECFITEWWIGVDKETSNRERLLFESCPWLVVAGVLLYK